jgi:hypothetical protein
MKVLALTGPPAAGKSTAVSLLEDCGVPCRDTGDAIRAKATREYDGSGDGPDEDYIWNIAQLIRDEHGPAGPTVVTEDWIVAQHEAGHSLVCLSSLRAQAEVDWLRDNIGETLVVKIDAPKSQREQRYVDMKMDADGVVSTETVAGYREELTNRELREQPYPSHDVTIWNSDGLQVHRLTNKLSNIVDVLQ